MKILRTSGNSLSFRVGRIGTDLNAMEFLTRG